MADDKFFGKGIGVAAGFDLGAEAPLDSRLVVNNEAELSEHLNGGRAYEGMIVFVKETGKTVQLVNGVFEDFGFNEEKFQAGIKPLEDAYKAADTALGARITALEGLVVGGEGEGIEAILGDVAELKEKVGAEAVEGEGEEEGTPATGLFAEIAALKAKDAELAAKDAELVAKDAELEEAIQNIQKAVEEDIEVAIGAIEGRVAAVEGKASALEEAVGVKGAEDVEATGLYKEIADGDAAVLEQAQQAVADAKALLEEADRAMDLRVDAVEAAAHEHGNASVLDGITAEQVAAWDAKATADDVQGAKDYADEKIAALVDSAPEAMDTLNELAAAINAHGDVYSAYVEEVSGKLAGKVDKVDDARLITETEAAQFAAKAEVSYVDAQVKAAKDYADGKDAAIQAAQADVDALEAVVGKDVEGEEPATGLIGEIRKAQADILNAKALADKGIEDAAAAQATANTANTEVGVAKQAASTAQAAAQNAQADVDALEELVGVRASEGIEATGLFADIVALQNKDNELVQADSNLSSRISVLEGLITGDEEVGGLQEIQANITALQQAVGQKADAEGNGATGLFLDIANLQAKDNVLQKAIEDEMGRAEGKEGELEAAIKELKDTTIPNAVSTINASIEQLTSDYKDADALLQQDIADLETAINTLRAKDTNVEADIAALQAKVGAAAVEGVEGEEGTPATGLFAEIAALKAKDAEVAAAVKAEEERAMVAEKANADAITTLQANMVNTFASLQSQIKEDGMLYTSLVQKGEDGGVVSEQVISKTEVAVMNDEDVNGLLQGIMAVPAE